MEDGGREEWKENGESALHQTDHVSYRAQGWQDHEFLPKVLCTSLSAALAFLVQCFVD